MIVAPERDVPGTSESTWASPMPSAVRRRHVAHLGDALAGMQPLDEQDDQAADHERRRHHRGREEALLDPVVRQEAHDRGRQERDQQVQQEPPAGRLAPRREHRVA